MKKLSFLLLLLLFSSLIAAEKQPAAPIQNENTMVHNGQTEKKRFTQFKFGLGADFEGMAGRPLTEDLRYTTLRNQLGISLGFDFGWIVFQKTEGKGNGNLCLGFGFDLQYWVPTTHTSPDNHTSSSDYDEMNYIYSHYMRFPLTLNMGYEFKVKAGTLRRVGPLLSLGINNNFFAFSYSTKDEHRQEYWEKKYNKEISHWKVSGTWELGIGMVFDNNWILNASIGGDFGNQDLRSHLFSGKTENKSKYVYTLYDRHEFLMFETGYRF